MKQSKSFLKKGFTLLELLVNVFIISLLSAIFLANYHRGERATDLERGAFQVAQDIRKTEEMVMSGKAFRGSFPKGGYGIYFQSNSSCYSIFADLNANNNFDGDNEEVSKICLSHKIKVKELKVDDDSHDTAWALFFPPEPTVKIMPSGSSLSVYLSLGDLPEKEIFLNKVGLVEVR